MNSELIAIERDCRRRQKELAHTIDGDWPPLTTGIGTLCTFPSWRCITRARAMNIGAVSNCGSERSRNMPPSGKLTIRSGKRGCTRSGGIAFLLVETIAVAVLAAIYFNAPRWLAMIIGVILAGLLGGAAGAVVARCVRHGAAEAVGADYSRVLLLGMPSARPPIFSYMSIRT